MDAAINQIIPGKWTRAAFVDRLNNGARPHSDDKVTNSEAARREAFHRMESRFPVNRGLSPIFLMMANAHKYAIDYIEQAPAIVAVVTRGTTHVSSSECAFFEEQFALMCERGARLREVMAVFGLPLPLRKLDARVLTASRATVLRRLALMNPSTLAQIIPDSVQKQNAWLEGLDQWCRAMAQQSRGQIERCPFFEWAAVNFVGITFREANGVWHLADYVGAHLDTFNPAWGLDRARRAEQDWHDDLASVDLDTKAENEPAAGVDYGALPKRFEMAGYQFVALQTNIALQHEGAAMQHCVASYWHSVVIGKSRIYSVREKGKRVATLELTDTIESYRWGKSAFRVRQLVGIRNSRPAQAVTAATAAFLKTINVK